MRKRSGWNRHWNTKEEDILRKIFSNSPREKIVRALPRFSWVQIKAKAYRMGLRRDVVYKTTYRRRQASEQTIEVNRRSRDIKAIEQHHRDMIRLHFDETALRQHIEAQERFQRGEISVAFPCGVQINDIPARKRARR